MVTTGEQDTQTLLADASRLALERIRTDAKTASPKVAPLLSYIIEHLFDPALNVATMKRNLGLRDNSIAIDFHRQVRLAPKMYITQRRLETAARLLLGSTLRVWRIAELVGYSSLGVFSKAFNRWAGQRPNAYRRHMRSLTEDIPPELFSPELLRRTVAGALTTNEAQRLVARLIEEYPEVRAVFFDEAGNERERGEEP